MQSATFNLNSNSIQINFDLAQLQTSGVSHNDTLYIRYLGGDGVLQGLSTDGGQCLWVHLVLP